MTVRNILFSFFIAGAVGITLGICFSKIKKEEKPTGNKGDNDEKNKNIIIGDSQTPFIANQSKNIRMIGKSGTEENLWKGGMGVDWLKKAVSKYTVDSNVKNVVISIGTNSGFSKYDDIKGLVNETKRVFPSAKLFVVQGSWGWGNNSGTTNDTVKTYYNRFQQEGVKLINTPIGYVADPHTNLQVYKEIGKNIDSIV